MDERIRETLYWQAVVSDWNDWYGDDMPAGSRAALVSVRIENDGQLPEITIVAVGEDNAERFLAEHEWAYPQTVERFIFYNELMLAKNPDSKPNVPTFRKLKKSELLQGRT